VDPIDAPKIQKPKFIIRKPRGSDIEWSNLVETKLNTSLAALKALSNVNNSSYNHKNTRTTFNVGPIICISSTNEGKTQVGWVVAIGKHKGELE
jgi:hypothetical protein